MKWRKPSPTDRPVGYLESLEPAEAKVRDRWAEVIVVLPDQPWDYGSQEG